MISLTKSKLRKIYGEKRNLLTKQDIDFLSEEIFKNYVLQFSSADIQNVHIFLSIERKKEINTGFFIDYFWKNNINVYVPKMIGDKLISVLLNSDTKLSKNSWGILEPESCENANIAFDQVITPMLYTDSRGYRVGYGKGFYDKFFKQINSNATKIGINYFKPGELISDKTDYDVPVDYLVTPDEILSFL